MKKPPDKPTISDYINAELDKLYSETAQPTIDQIQNLSTSQSGRMQISLRKLDDEAQRLEDNKENISADNAQLEQTINDYQATMTTSSDLIKSNDNTVQNSVIALAISAVTAKVFLYAAGKLMDAGKPPVGDYSMKFYTNAINQAGLSWNVITSADQVTNYVDSDAWTTKMEGYGEGYANLTRNTIIDMIQRGAGPKTVSSKMREHAENIPKHAADNLMRTLQLTSYRDASLAMETINGDSIEYKVRIAKLDDRTCLACIGLHGTRLEVGERVEDHYSGRCSEIYKVVGADLPDFMQADSQPGKRNFVPFQTGEEWFASLPPERQAKQASFSKSPAKLRAYQSGTKLSDFVGDHDDNVFGTQKVEKSLVGVLGEKAHDYYIVKGKDK